jgi:hypothetical protein
MSTGALPDPGEFIALVGARTAALVGKPWDEIAAVLGVDPQGQMARATANQETWSGLTVLWPSDDAEAPLPIELSGLPIFDRDRNFRGYRGFGVCRDLARLSALSARRAGAAPQISTPPDIPNAIAVPPQSESKRRPAKAAAAENVVPFPSTAGGPSAPALTAVEHMAFRELSRKLTEGLSDGHAGAAWNEGSASAC